MTIKKQKTIEDLLRITSLHKESELKNIPLYEASIKKTELDLDTMLKSYDLADVEPMHNPLQESAYVREDKAVAGVEADELLKCSKNLKDRYYLVPKFL